MARFEQFEVWAYQHNRWELVAAFFDQDTASAVASGRGSRVRVLRATYDNGALVEQETIAEIGTLRDQAG